MMGSEYFFAGFGSELLRLGTLSRIETVLGSRPKCRSIEMRMFRAIPFLSYAVLSMGILAFYPALACPPGTPELDKAKAKDPSHLEAMPAPLRPYTKKLWSCGCSNFRNKICDKGFEFTSMADATKYAKQLCGESCDPDCAGHAFKN